MYTECMKLLKKRTWILYAVTLILFIACHAVRLFFLGEWTGLHDVSKLVLALAGVSIFLTITAYHTKMSFKLRSRISMGTLLSAGMVTMFAYIGFFLSSNITHIILELILPCVWIPFLFVYFVVPPNVPGNIRPSFNRTSCLVSVAAGCFLVVAGAVFLVLGHFLFPNRYTGLCLLSVIIGCQIASPGLNMYDLKYDLTKNIDVKMKLSLQSQLNNDLDGWKAVSAISEIRLDAEKLVITEITGRSFLSFDICFSDDTRLPVVWNPENINCAEHFISCVKKSYVSESQFRKILKI